MSEGIVFFRVLTFTEREVPLGRESQHTMSGVGMAAQLPSVTLSFQCTDLSHQWLPPDHPKALAAAQRFLSGPDRWLGGNLIV